MQNVVRTPTKRSSAAKMVHTPPSVEQGDRCPKMQKDHSGKVFRRPSLKSQANSTLDSLELFRIANSSMSMKRSTPRPLNLNQPLTPPSSLKAQRKKSRSHQYQYYQREISETSTSGSSESIKTGNLESPAHFLSPSKNPRAGGVKPKNLRNSLRSSSNRSSSPSSAQGLQPIVWTDTVEDPYLEEDSPTYLCSISENVRSVGSSAGRRRFVSEQCSMCGESMGSVFPGETVIQMTCSHASHYECYLTMYESVYREGKWPQCRRCHEVSKPVDKDVIHKMTSNLLTRRESATSSIIEQHLGNATLSCATGSSMFDFTPRDRLITSADISSDGFKTPFHSSKPSINHEDEDTRFSYGFSAKNLFANELGSLSGDFASAVIRKTRALSDDRDGCDGDNLYGDNQHGLKIEINSLTNNHYSLTAEISKGKEHHGKYCKENLKRNQYILQEKRILRLQVENFVKSEIDPKDGFGSLSLFDQISYSTDGEIWNHNTLVCFFEKCLILFDVFEMKIIGKIPMEQVCHVNRLSETTLIIDLKCRTLPEIYLAFPPHLEDYQNILEKWKYYLMHPEKEPELEFMSDTAWGIFPKNMVPALMDKDERLMVCDRCIKPWENGPQSEAPLQLIICLSLCPGQKEDESEHKEKIVKGLHRLLGSLNDRDLLGIVTVGRNGRGEIGEYGSFVGIVSKDWSGWKEYIDDLETVDKQCFQTPLKEFNKIWETCHRLVSTCSFLLQADDQCQFSKQIILMNTDARIQDQGGKNKFEEIIKNDYGFDVAHLPSETSETSSGKIFPSIVAKLHQRRFKNLQVTLQGNAIFKFGDMAPGEKKTLYSELQKGLMLFNPRGNNSADIIRIPYTAQWYDLRTLAPEKIHSFALCHGDNRNNSSSS